MEDLTPLDLQRKQIFRNLRDTYVNYTINISRLLFSWLPEDDSSQGNALKILHSLIPIFAIALFFLLPKWTTYRLLVFIVAFVVFMSQLLFKGCIITYAERKLTGDNKTVVDPLLVLANINVNRDTRLAITLAGSSLLFIIVAWVLLCDYIHWCFNM